MVGATFRGSLYSMGPLSQWWSWLVRSRKVEGAKGHRIIIIIIIIAIMMEKDGGLLTGGVDDDYIERVWVG